MSLLRVGGAPSIEETAAGRMPIEVRVHTGADHELLRRWDRLVRTTPGTDVTQLSVWGRLRGEAGYTATHLLAFAGDRLLGGAQVLCRRVGALGAIGYVPYGPLLDVDVDPRLRAAAVEALCSELNRFARAHLRMLLVQPPEGAEAVSATLLELGFRPSDAQVAPPGSIRIDLTEDLALVRSRFGKRLRYWTNQWGPHGVEVRAGGHADLALLIDLGSANALHQGYRPLPAHYVETLYEQLAATGDAVLFVAELHGHPVAVDLMTCCGETIRGRLSGFDRSAAAARVSAPAAARWAAIGWAKAAGYRWFDFGGLDPRTLQALSGTGPVQGDVASCDQPKLTFGGTVFRYPQAVELVRPALARASLDLLSRTNTGARMLGGARDRMRGTVSAPARTEAGG